MSDAQPSDFHDHLVQQKIEVREAVTAAQEAVLAEMSRSGSLRSGAGIRYGVRMLSLALQNHITGLIDEFHGWIGPNLPEQEARLMLTGHFRAIVGELVQREFAYRIYALGQDASGEAFDHLLEDVRGRLLSRVRAFELGANRKPDARSIVNNTLNATAIHGPVQQGGDGASQVAMLTISVIDVAEALGRFQEALPDDLRVEAGPDIETIRQQIRKREPNTTIVQEAGKSLRTVMEGAAGGALGNAVVPAWTALATLIGLG